MYASGVGDRLNSGSHVHRKNFVCSGLSIISAAWVIAIVIYTLVAFSVWLFRRRKLL